jgi:predicted O-linked N-acetylglucosamine transferase (SPINDLY family)
VERRRALRTGLRSTLQSSALRDEAGFARKFENALRQMWRERCEMLASRRGS